jgi:hypothetical protein
LTRYLVRGSKGGALLVCARQVYRLVPWESAKPSVGTPGELAEEYNRVGMITYAPPKTPLRGLGSHAG